MSPIFVTDERACQTASVAVGKECIFYTVIKLHRSTAWGRSASRLGNGSIWASPGSAPTWQRKQKRAALLFIQIYYKRVPENRQSKTEELVMAERDFHGKLKGGNSLRSSQRCNFLAGRLLYKKWRENMVLKSKYQTFIVQTVMAGDLKSWGG